MFGTLGHAGPEGAFSIAGWFGVLVNFPGLLLGSFLRLGEDASETKMAIVLFLIQVPFLAYFFFIAIRAWRIRFGLEHRQFGWADFVFAGCAAGDER